MIAGRRTSFIGHLLALLLATAAVFAGTGYSLGRKLTPERNYGTFLFIHRDGWAEQGAKILLENLAPRGNTLQITFDTWRPPEAGSAHLSISVCGERRALFALEEGKPTWEIPLQGSCSPREVEIKAANPFIPAGEGDARELTAKVESVRVISRFGFAIADPLQFATLLASVLLTIYLIGWRAGALGIGVTAALVSAAAAWWISSTVLLHIGRPGYLWLLCISLLLGLRLAALSAGIEREPGQRRGTLTFWLAALVVTAGGAALRFYGLSFGLPDMNFHPDEVPKVNAIMRMVQNGNLNPQYFLHPSGLLYATYGMNSFLHELGIFSGDFRSTAFLAGRTVSALAGTLSVLLTCLIGRALFSSFVGLLGGLILAVLPLHIASSRYLKEDALLLFFILLTTLLVVRAVQSDRKWLLLLAGFFAGCAAGSKYSGMLAGAIVAGAPWFSSRSLLPDRRWLAMTAAAIAIMPAGFLLLTPYAIFDYQSFSAGFRSESKHMSKGHTVALTPWSQYWMWHFSKSIIPGMTWFTAVASAVGLGFLLRRGKIEGLAIVMLVLLFYLPAEWVKAKPAPQPERYIYPCLPYLALAFAALVAAFRSPRGRALAAVAALAGVLFPAVRSLQLASEVPYDTRNQLAAWVREHVPQGARILIDYKRYSPEFRPEEYQVEYMLQAQIIPKLKLDQLRQSGFDYLILSSLFFERYFSQPTKEAAPIRQRIRDTFARVPVVVQFAPQYGTYGFHNPTVTLFSLAAEDFARLDGEIAEWRAGKIETTSNQRKAPFVWDRISD